MSDVLQRLEKLAADAGLSPEIHDGSVVVKLRLSGGREQAVFISESGTGPRGETVIGFLSPCERLKTGFLQGISKAKSLDLLQRNAAMPFASFCMLSAKGTEMLCVRSTLMLETMDPPEFQAAAECVAAFADRYEAEQGRDDF